jgi:cobalt-zinc-cadmium efflux system outer membrane protein
MEAFLALLLTSAPISLDDALRLADETAEARSDHEALEVRRGGLRALGSMTSNPVISVYPGARFDPQLNGTESQASLSQSFNLAGLASRRRTTVGHELSQAEFSVLERLLLRRISIAQAWLDSWAAQRIVVLAEKEIEGARDLLGRVEKGAALGSVTAGERASARAFVGEARASRLAWEGRAFDNSAVLGALLGIGAVPVVPVELPRVPEAMLEELTAALANRSPAVRGAEAAALVEEAKEGELAAQWGTSLNVALVGQYESPTRWIGGVNLGVTLPVFETGERERLSVRAAAAERRGLFRQELAKAQVELRVVLHELEHTEETFEVVHDVQLAAAKEAATLETRRFQSGEITLQELLAVRRQAFTAEVNAILAQADVFAARVRANQFVAAAKAGEAR